jgi:hypothetical protein
MADAVTIQRVAGVIRSLESQLDMLSSRKDLSLRLMALSLELAVNSANSEIHKIMRTDKQAARTASD